jgi:hypothetical protein
MAPPEGVNARALVSAGWARRRAMGPLHVGGRRRSRGFGCINLRIVPNPRGRRVLKERLL